MAGQDVHGRARENGEHRQERFGDKLHIDAESVSARFHGSEDNMRRTLLLAFQAIGVIYGDLATSPLYVYNSTFTNGINDPDDVLGVLSLIIYTIVLLPLIKYCFIVLYANDNGDGGTFALYSLISRYAKVSLIPNQQAEDAMVSNYRIDLPSRKLRRAQWVKQKLETSASAKIILFFLAILGTSSVIGDGILTPAISVLSAVNGLQIKATSLTQKDMDWISVGILVVLFVFQRFGTDKVGYSFAPITSLWLLFISGIGIYNLVVHDITVLRAFNPKYIVDYFRRNGKDGFISLGGVVLCITGTEAMFADLGHFNVRAVQLSFGLAIFPSVLLAYIGQAAYLRKNPGDVLIAFYASIPGPLFWPQFVVAVLAAIIASQAMISGAFAIIAQSQTLRCFPRVKVIHTSKKYEGQVYIPEINLLLAIGTIIVTLAYKTTTEIGNAFGIAVLFVMTITTGLLIVVMLFIWKVNVVWIVLFFLVFGLTELLYLSSALYKFVQGGYLPIGVAAALVTIMAVWHYVHVKRYWYELHHIVTSNRLAEFSDSSTGRLQTLRRLPGVGFMYTDLVQGVPPIFSHLVEKIPFAHSVFVFVTIKFLPIPHVFETERFLFRRVQPGNYRLYRSVARFGYKDSLSEAGEFSAQLLRELRNYILDRREDAGSIGLAVVPTGHGHSVVPIDYSSDHANSSHEIYDRDRNNNNNNNKDISAEEEARLIEEEMRNGIVFLLGESEVVAARESSIFKKLAVNVLYNFLKRIFRQGDEAYGIPRKQLLKVGMTYEI